MLDRLLVEPTPSALTTSGGDDDVIMPEPSLLLVGDRDDAKRVEP